MNLRTALLALPLALVLAASFATAQPSPPSEADVFGTHLHAILKTHLENKKGLMFYVHGQTIPGAVKEIGRDWVKVSNQEYGQVLIRFDRIDAVAAN